eukprot:19537-Rhodomonas_salina.2
MEADLRCAHAELRGHVPFDQRPCDLLGGFDRGHIRERRVLRLLGVAHPPWPRRMRRSQYRDTRPTPDVC